MWTSKLPPPKVRKYWGLGKALKSLRGKVSKKKRRFKLGEFDLDLTYITPRMIAMGFPSEGAEGIYRNPVEDVQRFFETRHYGRYRIYNLCSEKAYDKALFRGRVARYPFDDHNPCPLHIMKGFCEDMDRWLGAHPLNVVAVHCKAGKGRTGLMLCAYMVHCGMFRDPEDSLAFFGSRRTSNGKGVTIPSQMRYVHYYSYMLRHGPSPRQTLLLHHVRFVTVPNSDGNGGCVPNLVVAVENRRIFDFKKSIGTKLKRINRPEPYIDFDLTPFNIRILGNARVQLESEGRRLCMVWFHTSYVESSFLHFDRHVTDKANKDKKGVFAPSFAVEMLVTRTTGTHTPFLGDDKVKKNVATSFLTEEQQATKRKQDRRRALGLPAEDEGGEGKEAASGAGASVLEQEMAEGIVGEGAGCYLCDTESDTEQELLRGEGLEGLIDDDEQDETASGAGDRQLGGRRVGVKAPPRKAPAPPARPGRRRAWIAQASEDEEDGEGAGDAAGRARREHNEEKAAVREALRDALRESTGQEMQMPVRAAMPASGSDGTADQLEAGHGGDSPRAGAGTSAGGSGGAGAGKGAPGGTIRLSGGALVEYDSSDEPTEPVQPAGGGAGAADPG